MDDNNGFRCDWCHSVFGTGSSFWQHASAPEKIFCGKACCDFYLKNLDTIKVQSLAKPASPADDIISTVEAVIDRLPDEQKKGFFLGFLLWSRLEVDRLRGGKSNG